MIFRAPMRARDRELPPGAAATFARGGRSFQQTHDEEAERLTAKLWDQCA